jgi:hypothetical protein
VPRWVPYVLAVPSLALAPGIARVFASAPLAVHWRLAWAGFDVAIAGLLAATGLALFRRSALAEVLAAMTATLLCCDAWLDVLSSAGQGTVATVAAIAESALRGTAAGRHVRMGGRALRPGRRRRRAVAAAGGLPGPPSPPAASGRGLPGTAGC